MAVVVAPMDMAAAESAAVETMVVVLAVEVAVVHVAVATAVAAIAIGLVAAVVAAVAVAEEVAMQVAVVEVAAKEVVAQVAALAVVDQFVAAVAVATAVAVVAVATAGVATVPVVATAMGVVALAIVAVAAVDVDVVVVAVEVAAPAATAAMEWIPWIQWQWWWQPWWVKWWQVLGIPLVALNTRQPNCQRMMKRTHLHMAHPSMWVIPIIGLQIWNTNLALQTSDLLVVSSSGLRPKDSASLRAKSSPKFLVVTLMFSYIIFKRDITNKVTSSSSVSSSISEVNLKAHHTWNSEDWIRVVVRKQTTSTFTTLS